MDIQERLNQAKQIVENRDKKYNEELLALQKRYEVGLKKIEALEPRMIDLMTLAHYCADNRLDFLPISESSFRLSVGPDGDLIYQRICRYDIRLVNGKIDRSFAMSGSGLMWKTTLEPRVEMIEDFIEQFPITEERYYRLYDEFVKEN